MSKYTDKTVRVRYLSGDDVFRYMQAKNIDANCIRCGARSWKLHDTADVRGTGALLVDAKGNVDAAGVGFIPQVSMTCDNCGTMWSISRGYINAWLDANPESANSGIQNTGPEVDE